MEPRLPDDAQRAYARVAGLFFFLVLAFDIAGLVITSIIEGGGGFADTARHVGAMETLYRLGLCLSLLGSLSTIPLAVCLYVTVKPVDCNLALMALLFRSAEAAVGAIGIVSAFGLLQVYLAANHPGAVDSDLLRALIVLHPYGTSTAVAAIFFCVGSTIFFYAFLRSHYIPRILSGWGVFASIVYLGAWFTELAAPATPALVNVLASLPILIAEVSTGLWLVIVGIRFTRVGGAPSG